MTVIKEDTFIKIRKHGPKFLYEDYYYIYVTKYFPYTSHNCFIEGEVFFSNNPEKELTFYKDFLYYDDLIAQKEFKNFLYLFNMSEKDFELKRKIIALKNS